MVEELAKWHKIYSFKKRPKASANYMRVNPFIILFSEN
jgi:hypothetical protein